MLEYTHWSQCLSLSPWFSRGIECSWLKLALIDMHLSLSSYKSSFQYHQTSTLQLFCDIWCHIRWTPLNFLGRTIVFSLHHAPKHIHAEFIWIGNVLETHACGNFKIEETIFYLFCFENPTSIRGICSSFP